MKSILAQVLIVGMAGAACAGTMEQARSLGFDLNKAKVETPAVPAPAVSAAGQLGGNKAKACFTLSGENGSGLPEKFCVAGLTLESTSGGGLDLKLFSDDQAIKGGKAAYVTKNGKQYASIVIYNKYDQVTFGEITLLAPVAADGTLVAGADLNIGARASYSPPGSHQTFQLAVKYSKSALTGPLQAEGVCYARPANEMADNVGMPVKFCVAGMQLEAKDGGYIALAIGGDLAGSYSAEYVKNNGGSYAKAAIFSKVNGEWVADGGFIEVLAPLLADGSLDLKGSLLVQAKAGHSENTHYSGWDYQAVAYSVVK